MNEELQLAVMGYIVATKKLPKSEQEINTIAQQVIQLKQLDPQQYNQLVQLGQLAKQQMAQQLSAGVKAKLGTKLNYINKLKGICPEGSESYYFKDGGSIKKGCKPCMAEAGIKIPKKKEEEKKKNNAVTDFKSKQANKKLDPKTTKNLPDGKYPSNWDGNDRMVWEREHGSKDEGAHTTKNKGIGKNLYGGKTKKHLVGGPLTLQKPNFASLAKKPNTNNYLEMENLQWNRDLPYVQAGYNPRELDSNMSLRLEEAARSGKGINNWMGKWAKKNKSPFDQMLYKRFQEMGGPQMRGGAVSSMVGSNPEDIIVTPKPGKMFSMGY